MLLDAKNSLDEEIPKRRSDSLVRGYYALATKNLLSEIPFQKENQGEDENTREEAEDNQRRKNPTANPNQ